MSTLGNYLLIGVAVLVFAFGQCNDQIVESRLSASDLNKGWKRHMYKKEQVLFPPILDAHKNQILTVLALWERPIKLQIDYKFGFPNCSIPLNITGNYIEPHRAVVLSNRKIVVSFTEKLMWNKVPSSRTLASYIVIIDPEKCTHIQSKIFGSEFSLVELFPYEDSFEIWQTTTEEPHSYSVLRYNDNGDLLKNYSIDILDDIFVIKVIATKEYDPSQGYYVVELNSNMSIYKLDSNFQIVGYHTFPLSEYTYSTIEPWVIVDYTVGNDQFTVCYKQGEKNRNGTLENYLQCYALDADLTNLLVTMRLSLSGNSFIPRAKIRNIGNGLMVFAHGVSRKGFNFIASWAVTYNNMKVEMFSPPYEIIEPKSALLPEAIDNVSDISLSTFEMQNGSYCLAAVQRDINIIAKCFNFTYKCT